MIPLASYQVCAANIEKGRALAVISISLAFGKYFAAFTEVHHSSS